MESLVVVARWLEIWTVSSHRVRSSCLRTLVHWHSLALLRSTLRVIERHFSYSFGEPVSSIKWYESREKERDMDKSLDEVREKSTASKTANQHW